MKATQSHSKDIAAVASELTTIVRETKPFLQAGRGQARPRSRRTATATTALTMMHPQSKPLQKPPPLQQQKVSLIQGSSSISRGTSVIVKKNLDVVGGGCGARRCTGMRK